VVLTFALSSVGYAATIVSGETSLLLLVAPALAALITRFIYYRNLRDLGWGLPKPRFALAAYVLPILVSGSVFVLAWLFAGYYTTATPTQGSSRASSPRPPSGFSPSPPSASVKNWGGAAFSCPN
jgi:hypothetical protein